MGTKWMNDDRLDDLSQTVVQQAHQARHVSRSGVRANQHHAVKRIYQHTPVDQKKTRDVLDLRSHDGTGSAAGARR